jgi:hypothetical protein
MQKTIGARESYLRPRTATIEISEAGSSNDTGLHSND